MWVWKQISITKSAFAVFVPSDSHTDRSAFDSRAYKPKTTVRQSTSDDLQWARGDDTPQHSPHIFPAFFVKQIPRPGASTHMQIGAAWVFSITCCDLHSWFVWAHRISTNGQEGQDRLMKCTSWYIYYNLLCDTTWIHTTDPRQWGRSSTCGSWSCDQWCWCLPSHKNSQKVLEASVWHF